MTASDAQLAELIEMEQKPAKRERRIPRILKLHMQYRGRYPSDPEFVLPNWYRDFEIADKTTLEQLAGIMLQILGWVEDHLYEFKIKGRRYVNFGNDGDYVVGEEDKRQLVEWRASNDKRLWQKAVAVLDHRSLLPEEIAKKIEVPVDVIQGWITTYNRQGLAGLNAPRKKRSPGKKGAALERKKKRILGLIHGRPQAFGINRASWNLPSLAAAYKQCYGEIIS